VTWPKKTLGYGNKMADSMGMRYGDIPTENLHIPSKIDAWMMKFPVKMIPFQEDMLSFD